MRWVAADVSQCNHGQILDFGCLIRKIAADDFLSLEYPPAIKRVYHPPVIADSPISTFDYHRAIRDFGTAWWPGTVALAEGLVAFSFSASVLPKTNGFSRKAGRGCRAPPQSSIKWSNGNFIQKNDKKWVGYSRVSTGRQSPLHRISFPPWCFRCCHRCLEPRAEGLQIQESSWWNCSFIRPYRIRSRGIFW